MDTGPIYELRERLRAAAMAGTNLLSEDFRLKRAFESFRPLEAASPVFAKVGQLTEKLLSPDCPNQQGALLETITLVDAVLCTLGSVDVSGEVEPIGLIDAEENTNSLVVNAPYSSLKELLESLTTSGGGRYGYVCEQHDSRPELFRDYRVRYAMIQALGASYAELADKVEQWLIEDNDKTILPLLYRGFDPKGKKEMVRRVRVISALAKAEANDYYIKMLASAQKDVRTELIYALRHDPQNTSLLLDMSKTEKGKNKDKVFELLAEIKDENVSDYFRELAKKKPDMILQYLKNTTTDWAAELVADICEQTLEKLKTIDSASTSEEKQEMSHRLRDIVRALFGKGGVQICACYRKLLAQKGTINSLFKEAWPKPKNVYERDVLQYGVLQMPNYRYSRKSETRNLETALGKVLHHSLLVNPDSDLQALALELYHNVKFLPAAVTVKFSKDEDCTDWLEEQVEETNALGVSKLLKERMKAVVEAVAYVQWDEKKNSYVYYGSFIDVDYPDSKSIEYPIKLSYANEIVEWLKKHASKEVDEILVRWVRLNDEEMCKMMGEYFYKKALITADSYSYQEGMKLCGWTVCKGLGVKFLRSKQDIYAWTLHSWMISLPGSYEAIMEEARTICDMLRSGELKVRNLKVDDFEGYMNSWNKVQI